MSNQRSSEQGGGRGEPREDAGPILRPARPVGGTVPARSDAFPGYRLGRVIHRGGQGVVYEAFEEAAHRKVAIKQFHFLSIGDTAAAARFDREVGALAQVRHPNIVTMHASAAADGRRFLVMEYVDGQPLHRYLAGAALSAVSIAALFVKISEAVNAAHLVGVIHRDLKPQNILVDARGEPYVVDFGLAKRLAETDGPAVTATGQFVGSLPWSAPEQVEGSAGGADTRTDVYALGVMLYHALAGSFPYDVSGSQRQVMEQIVRAEPRRLRSMRPGIADDLEAIVLKCLKKDPGERYQNAGDVARELRRYLAHEPIEAKRDSTWYIVRKQLRRHRAASLMVAAGLGGVVLYGATATVLLRRATLAELRARQAEHVALDAAERERARAAAQRETLSFLVNEVAGGLRHIPAARPFREQILSGAYDRLLAARQAEPGNARHLDADVARAEEQLGDLAVALGEMAEALEHFERALVIREARAGAEPDNPTLQAELSVNLVKVGDMHEKLGRPDKRDALYNRAAAIDEALVHTHPDNTGFRDNLLWTKERLGHIARQAGDFDRARALFEAQRALGEQLVSAEPGNALRHLGLARGHRQLAELAQRTGDDHLVLRHEHSAAEAFRTAVDLEPLNTQYARQLASAYFGLATAYASLGQNTDARHYDALAVEAQLSAPQDVLTLAELKELSDVLRRAATSARERGDFSTALTYIRKLEHLGETALLLYPEAPTTLHLAADVWKQAGAYALLQNKIAVAEQRFNRSLEIWEQLPVEHRDAEHRRLGGWIHSNLAAVARWRGEWDQAEAHARSYVACAERVVELAGPTQDGLADLFTARRVLFEILYEAGRPEEARPLAAETIALGERMLKRFPGTPEHAIRVAHVLGTVPEPALRDPERAVALLEPVCGRDGEDRPWCSQILGRVYCAAGRTKEGLDVLYAFLGDLSPVEARVRHLVNRAIDQCGGEKP